MPIDLDELARSIGRLGGVEPEAGGLEAALQLVVDETTRLFAVDGAGMLLLAEDGVLRYVAASDEPGRMLEALQEQTGEGPCVDAFLDDQPVSTPDMAAAPQWLTVGRLAVMHGIHAVLGVPVDLRGGPVGTLNVYASQPHPWDEVETAAIGAYARVAASLLRAAADAHLQGQAAARLRHALDHRAAIEQAKGILMERRRVGERAAYDLLRGHARSTRRPLVEVARQVIAGQRLPGLTTLR